MRRINDGDEALLCPGPLPSCNKPPQGSSQGAAGGRSGLQAIVRPRRLEARRSLSELRPLHLQRLQQLPRLLGVRFPFAFRVAHGHCIRLRRRSQHLFHSVGDKDDSIFSILLCRSCECECRLARLRISEKKFQASCPGTPTPRRSLSWLWALT